MLRLERPIVCVLMALAASRVALYSALLPALTRQDELQHYDRVLSVSHGDLSLGLKPTSSEATDPCLWAVREPAALSQPGPAQAIAAKKPVLLHDSAPPNHECCEPPLYYAVDGAWHALGAEIVWRPPLLPYWDRFLNCLVAAATVGLAYCVSRQCFSGSAVLVAPAFLAMLPQSDLYGIDNDVLMPIAFGLFTLAYVRFFESRRQAIAALACGLALALCAWIKTTSAPLIAVGCAAMALALAKSDRPIRNAAGFGCGLLAAVPLVAWNLHAFGHLTGAFTKMQIEYQTIKPVAAWSQHAVFTPAGSVLFLTELTNSYWLGEMPWNQRLLQSRLNVPWMLIWLCPVLTAAVIIASMRMKRPPLRMAVASVVVSVVFLAVSSAATDFGVAARPSIWWNFPGFVGGRLMIGTLIPFSVLVSAALGRVTWPSMRLALFVSILLLLNAISAWMLADCFGDRYCNLFTEL